MKELKNNYETQDLLIPEGICWLYGTFFEDYLYDVEICQRFAKRNRERMAEIILERTGMTAVESFHTIHNYIDVNEMILRKGAIAAHAGEKVLIPINMRDGSIIAGRQMQCGVEPICTPWSRARDVQSKSKRNPQYGVLQRSNGRDLHNFCQ